MNLLSRNAGLCILLAIVAAFVMMALRGPTGVPALMHKRREIQLLQERNATLAAENDRKRQRIEKLKHDPDEQQLMIRERLKLLKPGETQFVVPGNPAGN
jgi:cell division protein FtsB